IYPLPKSSCLHYLLYYLLFYHSFFFFFLMIRPLPRSTLFPYTTLFRSLDTNIVIFLSLAKDRIKLRISFIPIGSNPLVGSSNISSSGLWRSALAIPSLCFIPKEYLPTSFFVSLCRSTISKASSIVFFL